MGPEIVVLATESYLLNIHYYYLHLTAFEMCFDFTDIDFSCAAIPQSCCPRTRQSQTGSTRGMGWPCERCLL